MLEKANYSQLPAIPEKRYFTIGEVSDLCAVKSHVLRYWEEEFSQMRQITRRGNRCYQRDDVILIRQIRRLLYEDGFTIGGAKQHLIEQPVNKKRQNQQIIRQVWMELEEVLEILKGEEDSIMGNSL
jgi:DNA-binding transcriptional MerR regulator